MLVFLSFGEDQINKMDIKEMRDVLTKAASIQLGFIVNLLEENPIYFAPGNSQISWCVCSNHSKMETDEERICCGKQGCLSLHPVSFCFLYLEFEKYNTFNSVAVAILFFGSFCHGLVKPRC